MAPGPRSHVRPRAQVTALLDPDTTRAIAEAMAAIVPGEPDHSSTKLRTGRLLRPDGRHAAIPVGDCPELRAREPDSGKSRH